MTQALRPFSGEAVLSACAGHTSGICALPAVLPSQVGTALELNSPAIAHLPPWPSGLPVLDFAGDMGLRIPVGLLVLHRFDVGDVAVTVGSATAHNTTGGPVIKHCSSLTLLGAIYRNPGPCFHTHLVNDGDIIADDPERHTFCGRRTNHGGVPRLLVCARRRSLRWQETDLAYFIFLYTRLQRLHQFGVDELVARMQHLSGYRRTSLYRLGRTHLFTRPWQHYYWHGGQCLLHHQ